MAAMREKWTDERLDDLNYRVAEGFDRVDADLRSLRVEMKSEISSLRAEMVGQMDSVRGEINSLRGEMGLLRAESGEFQRTMLQLGGGMIATFAVGFAGLIATQL
jgi:hypothetical protein